MKSLQQADSTAQYSFELTEDTAEQQVFVRPRTPYQAIRLLPHHASESEKDDIVRKYFEPVIVKPSQRPDTLYIPGLKGRGLQWEEIPTYKDGFFSKNPMFHPELKVVLNGIPGTPVPYRLRSDVFVMSTLLLSFFVAMYILSRSMHVLQMQMKNFFFKRDRNQIFTLKSDNEMKNQFFIVLLACFLLSILFFNYTEMRMTTVFNQVSPYMLLGLDMGIFLLYYVVKYIGYMMVNWVFFPLQSRSQWMNAYNFIVLSKALCLLPVVLLVVYFDMPIHITLTLVGVIVGLFGLLVIFKAKQIFFGDIFGLCHLFLYFCTLELAPLLFLLKMLVIANEYLTGYI